MGKMALLMTCDLYSPDVYLVVHFACTLAVVWLCSPSSLSCTANCDVVMYRLDLTCHLYLSILSGEHTSQEHTF